MGLLAGVFAPMLTSLMGVSLMTISNAFVLLRAREKRNRCMEEYLISIESKVHTLLAADGESAIHNPRIGRAYKMPFACLQIHSKPSHEVWNHGTFD